MPEERIAALKLQLTAALDKSSIKARDLASIVGKIISMTLAMGPVSRLVLMTRRMYAFLNSRMYWCQRLEMNLETRSEMEFWHMQVDCINGHEIWHSPSAVRLVYSDASGSGYGGFTVEHGCHVAHGAWSAEEMLQATDKLVATVHSYTPMFSERSAC